MQPVIRDARPSDARRFEEIRIGGWKAAYVGMIDAEVLDALSVDDERVAQREQWLADLPAGEVMLVAEVDAEVVAGAILLPSCDEDVPDAAELVGLYVDPGRRFSGLGSALLTAGFARMPQSIQILWVLAGNESARRFYERHGFLADGVSKEHHSPGNPVEVRYRRTALG